MSGVPTDVDRHGLVTLINRWTPKGMRADPEALRLLTALWYSVAHVLNPLLDGEAYLPIIFNPRRCLDDDLTRVLGMNGIQARPGSLSFPMLRRLAMLAPELRAWRGAFRSHRTVVSALTGGATVVQTWVQQRAVLDVSSMDIILLDEEFADTTLVYLLGQGPDASPEYSLDEVMDRVDQLAKPVLDEIEYVECFALTAWRNGAGGWGPGDGFDWPDVIQSPLEGEFESADIGPDVSSDAEQYLTAPTRAPTPSDPDATHAWYVTVWFKTDGATENDRWELWLLSTGEAPNGDGYVVKVPVGHNRTMQFCRIIGGVATVLANETVTFADGADGSYHRLDVVIELSSTLAARIRAYCNHDPTTWHDDPGVVGTRPSGVELQVGLRPSIFTTGRFSIGAVIAKFSEAS